LEIKLDSHSSPFTSTILGPAYALGGHIRGTLLITPGIPAHYGVRLELQQRIGVSFQRNILTVQVCEIEKEAVLGTTKAVPFNFAVPQHIEGSFAVDNTD
jgi:hypothetical protein